MTNLVLLFAAGLLAGAMNAAAGGGSFVSFPALVLAGVPSVAANMTSTVALFPGSFASAYAYRNDFRPFEAVSLRLLLAISLVGGALGAVLLHVTSSKTFDAVVPWLLLTGTIAFAFGRPAGEWLRKRMHIGPAIMLAAQFLLGIYGGYFGGAVGIMMMATWSLLGTNDLNALNAAKSVIVGSTNAVAVVVFVLIGTVFWLQAMVMLVAGLVGGYVGARVARKIEQRKLRIGITCLNCAITAAFFWRIYG
jgi:uncharacterized membrane protein YfcA